MLKRLSGKYLDNHDQVRLIGLQTALLTGSLSVYYLFLSPNNIGLIVMIIGALITSLMMSSTYHGHNSKERNTYGFVTAILSGVTYFLGSYCNNSLIATSIGIVLILPWVGLVNSKNPMLFGLCFYIFDGFVLGFGVPSSHLHTAISIGVYYGFGGFLLILSGVIRMIIRSKFLNIHETLPFISKKPLLDLSRDRVFYTVGMVIAVLISNWISIHFHLEQGFWLTMTTFLIFKDNHAVSMKRASYRFFGTLLGGIVAFAWFSFADNKLTLVFFLFPLVYFTVVSIAKNYASYTFFLTITISILFNLMITAGTEIVTARIITTFIGILIALIVLQIIHKVIERYFTFQMENKCKN